MIVGADPAVCTCQIAEHKADVVEYKTHLALSNICVKKIAQSIDPEWLEAENHPTFWFHQSNSSSTALAPATLERRP